MKYLRQMTVILAISFVGEMLSALIPLPIPASIYGILLLFALLETGLLRVDAIRETSSFLIVIMPLLFVPACTGLMDSFGLLRESLAAYIVITVVSTVAVMGVSALAAQATIRREGRGEGRARE